MDYYTIVKLQPIFFPSTELCYRSDKFFAFGVFKLVYHGLI